MAQDRFTFRTVFVSDVHLGSVGCQAGILLDFLARVRPHTLFLVGDIIDMESLSRHFFWPQAHNDVLREVLGHARRGARVVYIPGNHDIQARAYSGLKFGRIEIRRKVVHATADGRRLLVTHGDTLDRHMNRDAWLHRVGSRGYQQLLRVNSHVNHWRRKAGLDYWSLASSLKHRSRAARTYMNRFREAALAQTREQGFDGCVVGHIHRPEIVHSGGLHYMNCGDWVEHCTALVEHADGRFELLDWTKPRSQNLGGFHQRVEPLPRAA